MKNSLSLSKYSVQNKITFKVYRKTENLRLSFLLCMEQNFFLHLFLLCYIQHSSLCFVYIYSHILLTNLRQQMSLKHFKFLLDSTITHKIFESNSNFHVKQCTMENFDGCFSSLLLVLTKLSFQQGDWALGYYSMKFRKFPDISKFPKILSLKAFDNS